MEDVKSGKAKTIPFDLDKLISDEEDTEWLVKKS
jgi:hypothetical protein